MTRFPSEEEVLRRIRPTPEARTYIRAMGERLTAAADRSGRANALKVS